MKQFLLCFCMISLVFFVFSCKNEVPIDNPIENPSDNPSEEDNKPVNPPSDLLPDDENDVVEDTEKTYLEITNNSQYDVNVYMSSFDSVAIEIQAGTKVTKEVSTNELKDNEVTILIEYEYNIGSVTIPYFNLNNKGCKKIIPIYKNETNSLKLSELDSLSFDETYLILQNKTFDYIYVSEFESEDVSKKLTKFSSEDTWIKPETEGLYDITNINLGNCYIVDGDQKVRLNIGRLNSDRVYTVSYDGNGVSVLSIDLGLNPKNDKGLPIYTISSVEDLKNISKYDDVDANFELTCNIDGNNAIWNPIPIFKGTLQGNNFSIENFYINSCSALGDEEPCGRQFGSGSSSSTEYCRPAFCGFFYENNGKINNIFFKNITVNATFEYQTDDWRYVYVGAVAGRNDGIITNVHLENIIISSKLNHQKNQNGTPHQVNLTGGFFGRNNGKMSYCSIKNSEIKASTSAKKNRCHTSTYVGGICGKLSYDVDNILAISTFVTAYSEGGFMDGWFTSDDLNDGILKSYAGNLFGDGSIYDVSRVLTYKGSQSATTNAISNNPTEENKTGSFDAIGDLSANEAFSIWNLQDLENSPILDWENWSIQDGNPENYLD